MQNNSSMDDITKLQTLLKDLRNRVEHYCKEYSDVINSKPLLDVRESIETENRFKR